MAKPISKPTKKKTNKTSGRNKKSASGLIGLRRRIAFSPKTAIIVAVGLTIAGYFIYKTFAAVTPYCTLTITGSGTPSSSNLYTATWRNYNYFGANLSAKLVHTYNGNTANLAFSATGSTAVVPASATEKGYRYEVWNGGTKAYSCTPGSVAPPPPPPSTNPTCSMTNPIPGPPYVASWRTTGIPAGANWGAILSRPGGNVSYQPTSGSASISPPVGTTTYTVIIYDKNVSSTEPRASWKTACTANVTVPASVGGGGGGSSGGGSGGGSTDSGGGSGGGESTEPGNGSGGSDPADPGSSGSEEFSDPGSDSSGGFEYYDPYTGYTFDEETGDSVALVSLGEVSLDDLEGATDDQVEEIVEKSLIKNGNVVKNSNGSPILRSYSGKIKLLPPQAAITDGADTIKYYINHKLKATVKKSPYAYTLDTTRLKNRLYALTMVAYQNGEKINEYNYPLSVKNKLNFWQSIYNIITAPFVR